MRKFTLTPLQKIGGPELGCTSSYNRNYDPPPKTRNHFRTLQASTGYCYQKYQSCSWKTCILKLEQSWNFKMTVCFPQIIFPNFRWHHLFNKTTHPASVKIPLKPCFPLHLRGGYLGSYSGSNPTGDFLDSNGKVTLHFLLPKTGKCLNDLKKNRVGGCFSPTPFEKRCGSRQIGSWNHKGLGWKQQIFEKPPARNHMSQKCLQDFGHHPF